jgi:hypothetical protein
MWKTAGHRFQRFCTAEPVARHCRAAEIEGKQMERKLREEMKTKGSKAGCLQIRKKRAFEIHTILGAMTHILRLSQYSGRSSDMIHPQPSPNYS